MLNKLHINPEPVQRILPEPLYDELDRFIEELGVERASIHFDDFGG